MSRYFRWALVICICSVVAYYVFQEYWYYIPGLVSYLKFRILPRQNYTWKLAPISRTSRLEDKRPNIIFIVADDLGFNDVSYNRRNNEHIFEVASHHVPTPHIDSIADTGAFFSNAYAGHATCSPSRAAIMTGRYATRFGFEFTPVPRAMAKVCLSDQPYNLIRSALFQLAGAWAESSRGHSRQQVLPR